MSSGIFFTSADGSRRLSTLNQHLLYCLSEAVPAYVHAALCRLGFLDQLVALTSKENRLILDKSVAGGL
jgi:hypothetical protein